MSVFLLLLAFVTSGYAVHYSPGNMERVYRVRIRQGLVQPGWAGGLAATPYCSNIGRVVSASFLNPHTQQWTPSKQFLLVDCAQDRHRAGQIARGLVIETDYKSSQWAGFTSEGRTRAKVIWGGK